MPFYPIIGCPLRWSRGPNAGRPDGRTTRVALWTGIGHVLGSIALGVIVIALGYGLKGDLRLEGPIVGIVLVLTGVGLLLWSLRHPGHHHPHPHEAEPDQPMHTSRGMTTDTATFTPTSMPIIPIMGHGHDHTHHHDNPRTWGARPIPAGIAASPDPTILPVFLAAIAVNIRTAIEVLVVYSLVTMVAMVGLTLTAVWGGYQVQWAWLDQHANHVTTAVLVALGIAAWVAF